MLNLGGGVAAVPDSSFKYCAGRTSFHNCSVLARSIATVPLSFAYVSPIVKDVKIDA